jgi:hypothetical protein
MSLAMTFGGAGWVLWQLLVPHVIFGKLFIGACALTGIGAYWLWCDYINATPKPEA